jgi:Mor family transcriptional regulator
MEQTPPDERLPYVLIFHNVLGISPADIAKHYGISIHVVEEMLRTTKKPLSHSGILQNINELYRRWSRGEQIKALADEYNCSRHALRRALTRKAESIRPGLYLEIVKRKKHERQNLGSVWRPSAKRTSTP